MSGAVKPAEVSRALLLAPPVSRHGNRQDGVCDVKISFVFDVGAFIYGSACFVQAASPWMDGADGADGATCPGGW